MPVFLSTSLSVNWWSQHDWIIKVSAKTLLASGFCLSLLSLCLWKSHQTGLFDVKTIEVLPMEAAAVASFPLVESQVKNQLSVFLHQPIWKMKISEMTERVMRERWVKDARITRAFPDTIKVWIQPRQIAALLLDKDRQILPVAVDASLLPLMKNSNPDAPYLSGQNLYENVELRRRAIEVLSQLPDSGLLSHKAVSEIFYNTQEGFVLVLNTGGLEVLLGENSNMEKIFQINSVLDYVSAKKIKARVIDARLSKKVLVRLRKRP